MQLEEADVGQLLGSWPVHAITMQRLFIATESAICWYLTSRFGGAGAGWKFPETFTAKADDGVTVSHSKQQLQCDYPDILSQRVCCCFVAGYLWCDVQAF